MKKGECQGEILFFFTKADIRGLLGKQAKNNRSPKNIRSRRMNTWERAVDNRQ
jgi:hypothetical protein